MSNGFEMCDQHVYLFATEGKDCPYCKIEQLEQELAAEKKAAGHWMEQSCKDHNRAEKLEQELSRYQGAVEVEGDFWVNGLFNCTIHIRDDFGKLDDVPAGCRVRVLVKEVE